MHLNNWSAATALTTSRQEEIKQSTVFKLFITSIRNY